MWAAAAVAAAALAAVVAAAAATIAAVVTAAAAHDLQTPWPAEPLCRFFDFHKQGCCSTFQNPYSGF